MVLHGNPHILSEPPSDLNASIILTRGDQIDNLGKLQKYVYQRTDSLVCGPILVDPQGPDTEVIVSQLR